MLPSALAVLAVVAVGGALAWRGLYGDFGYNLFTDRDLARGLALSSTGVSPGAELSGGTGARIPGWLSPVVFGLPQLVAGAGARPVMACAGGLAAVGVVLLGLGTVRRLGALAAWTCAVLTATHPAVLGVLADLWNPSFVVLPAAAAAVALLRVADDGDPRAVAAWSVAVALGAQLHLSMLALGLASLPGVLWRTRGHLRRTILLVVVPATLAYAPHLAQEAAAGWPNTRALLEIPAVSGPAGGGPALVREALALLTWGVPGAPGPEGPLASWLPATGVALLAAPVLAGAPGVLPPRHARRVRVVAWPVYLVLAAYLPSSMPYMAPRYLTVLVPALAVGAAAAVAGLREGGSRGVSWAVAVLTLGLTLPRVAWLEVETRRTDPLGHGALEDALATLVAERGSLQEVVGRTVWRTVSETSGPPLASAGPAVAHLLLADGSSVPGSLSPPCTALVSADEASLPDAALGDGAVLARLLRLEGPVAVVGPPRRVAKPWRAIDYVPVAGACPTSMTQRYVDTPIERVLHPLYGRLEAGEVRRVPGLPQGWVVGLPRTPPPQAARGVYPAAITLTATDVLEVRLEANQLRGLADNSGWFIPAALSGPTVVFERDDARHEVVLAPGRVGHWWAATPLAATVALPAAGPWRVRFRAVIETIDASRPDPVVASGPFEVVLDERWELPPR
ncbi:MAG: hypothetical protein H6732_13180 [Alphaproteobacteria bacterium]|nr:hypothetical protein [Alphaproteobacteria bacterium]